MLYVLLALCSLVGVLFAALAVWLTTQRGNTIRDILASTGSSTEVLKAEVAGKFKFATNMPIVALYAVAATIAIGPVAYWMYLASQNVHCGSGALGKAGTTGSRSCYAIWRVSGNISTVKPPPPIYAAVRPPAIHIEVDGSFNDEIPVKLDESGEPIWPSLTFSSSDDFEAPVVHLQEPAPVYKQRIVGPNVIKIETPIEVVRKTR